MRRVFILLTYLLGLSVAHAADSVFIQQLGDAAIEKKAPSAINEKDTADGNPPRVDHQQEILSNPNTNDYARMKSVTTGDAKTGDPLDIKNDSPSDTPSTDQLNEKAANMVTRELKRRSDIAKKAIKHQKEHKL
ncbi:MAG: hypothetical protein EBR02_00990 [Alphaproteobacteria bacterium]|nr:hypothetical protein [Alphaproteobacteria bacterium]